MGILSSKVIAIVGAVVALLVFAITAPIWLDEFVTVQADTDYAVFTGFTDILVLLPLIALVGFIGWVGYAFFIKK